MSGHSKWSTIKRKKGALDAKRGKIFTRAIHEISVAVKEGGGGDPSANPRLRFAIERAKAVNMPNENIDRAIKRATGEDRGSESFEVVYEGYGPGGVAVIIEAITDNKNRTVSDVRHAFSRHAGSMGEAGCVAWMFEKKGIVLVEKKLIDEDRLMELALGAGAEDVMESGDQWEIVCDSRELQSVRAALEPVVLVGSAEVQMLPKSRVRLAGGESERVIKLLEALEDLDDVMSVVSNCEFADEPS